MTKSLVYFYVVAATTFGTSFELVLSGAMGISLEHILLCLFFILMVFSSNNFNNWNQVICFYSFISITILSIVGSISTLSSLHLLSFMILIYQVHVFQKNKELVNEKLVLLALLLIFIQIVFNKNPDDGTWDWVYAPGFGLIKRLGIYGFVSTSLAIMLLPFVLFACVKIKEGLNFYLIPLLGSLITISLTFSRIGLLISILILVIYFPIQTLVIIPFLVVLIIWATDFPFHNLLLNLDSAVFRKIIDNDRFHFWKENLSSLEGADFLIGKGLMLVASDNTFVSIFFGGGVLLTFFFVILILSYLDFRIRINRDIIILIVSFLLASMTIDMFSQRKIIFSFALIAGYLNARRISA